MTAKKKNLSKQERKEQALDEYWRKRKPLRDEYKHKEKLLWDEYLCTLREIDAEVTYETKNRVQR